MPKTAFVFSAPRIKFVDSDKVLFFLQYLTSEIMDDAPHLSFTPVILGVTAVPNSNQVSVSYAYRYEVEE